MENYVSPFELTNKMFELVSEISNNLGKLEIYNTLQTKPHLRKNNRVKSVYSSCRIENNSLSEEVVSAILNNIKVIGPENEIKEIQNAFKAYEQINDLNPYSISDLKKTHAILTNGLILESGDFRKGEEGVFAGDVCIFMAPPANMVKENINDLFNWMKLNSKEIHPLIMSCVFHFEFVFIHPFADGNGRMARLWQTLILSKWNKLFEYLPIESQIEKYQQEYYDKILECENCGTSTSFIEFMLNMINKTIVENTEYKYDENKYVNKLLSVMKYGKEYSILELLDLMSLKSRNTIRDIYIKPAIKAKLIKMKDPKKPTSKNQRYIKI